MKLQDDSELMELLRETLVDIRKEYDGQEYREIQETMIFNYWSPVCDKFDGALKREGQRVLEKIYSSLSLALNHRTCRLILGITQYNEVLWPCPGLQRDKALFEENHHYNPKNLRVNSFSLHGSSDHNSPRRKPFEGMAKGTLGQKGKNLLSNVYTTGPSPPTGIKECINTLKAVFCVAEALKCSPKFRRTPHLVPRKVIRDVSWSSSEVIRKRLENYGPELVAYDFYAPDIRKEIMERMQAKEDLRSLKGSHITSLSKATQTESLSAQARVFNIDDIEYEESDEEEEEFEDEFSKFYKYVPTLAKSKDSVSTQTKMSLTVSCEDVLPSVTSESILSSGAATNQGRVYGQNVHLVWVQENGTRWSYCRRSRQLMVTSSSGVYLGTRSCSELHKTFFNEKFAATFDVVGEKHVKLRQLDTDGNLGRRKRRFCALL
ncbi:hypothetical protein HDU76_008371 [Blyttiomyces sp. JEL0837]|nr:hypothetical protein HDU76_008371 [Blyttiomyces sp. JEL0837]